jgi:hypothetical protein
MKVVAAGLYLKRLEELVHNANPTSVRLVDAYFAILDEMMRINLVGTPEELRDLRRIIRKDAFGLRVRRDTRVNSTLRHVLRNSAYLAPRAAGANGASDGHRFGLMSTSC